MRITRRIAVASLMAVALAAPAFADDKPTILASVPGLTFPFFVYMMASFKAEAQKLGVNVIESDGQLSSPKQTADIEDALAKSVNGIVLSPNEVDAMAPSVELNALAVTSSVSSVPLSSRRSDRATPSSRRDGRCARRSRALTASSRIYSSAGSRTSTSVAAR